MKNYKLYEEKLINKCKLLNIELLGSYIGSKIPTLFKCFCNKEFLSQPNSILCGNVKSCGCYKKQESSKRLIKNLVGKNFGRLTVLKDSTIRRQGSVIWQCLCNPDLGGCGQICMVCSTELIVGDTKSCGCLAIELNKARIGEKCPAWNPNLTNEQREQNKHKTRDYNFSKSVYIRDNYTCQYCGTKKSPFNAHHYLNWAEYPELRFDLNNAVCLCELCHNNFHNKYGRKNNTKEQFEEFKRSFNRDESL